LWVRHDRGRREDKLISMEGDYDHIVNRGSLYVKRYLHVRNPCLAEPAHDATVPSARQANHEQDRKHPDRIQLPE
jgi:hypothetical protein